MRRLLQSGLAAGVAAALLVPAAPALAASGGSDASSGLAPVGSAAAVPSSAIALGAVPGDQTVSFDVVLKPRDQAALDEFVRDVSTPGSSQYHQFLKTGEFAQRFGPTSQAISTVTAQLKRLGLDVGTVNGSAVRVSGSVSAVSAALHTPFKQYRLKSGHVAHANTAAPELPASIAPLIGGVIGLDDLTVAVHPQLRTASTSATPSVTPNVSTAPAPCAAASTTLGSPYTADEIASQYGLTSYYNAGDLGGGVTVAIFELEPFAMSDINAYQTCYGTHANVSVVNVDGGPGSGYGSGEAALDIEDVIGLAPAANVVVYQGPSADSGTLTYGQMYDTYNQIATDNTAQVVSTSWGGCEPDTNTSFAAAESGIFQQMATQGQTMFAASGDAGSADCDRPAGHDSQLAVDDPASQPYVTGVGGTTLTSVGATESTWNDGIVNAGTVSDPDDEVSAGGGGKSTFWTKPSWQTVTDTVREVPDVSASADPAHGYAVYFGGDWLAIGGTSAAAPTWAALMALIDSSCSGHRLGLINPALYQLAGSGTSPFNDVTTGDNDGDGQNGGDYSAGTGYDMATGLGTPKGALLGAGLCPPPSDGGGAMTVNHTAVQSGSSNTLTFTYTPPSGTTINDGDITVEVPAGWTAPSTTPGDAGYTTSSSGTVHVSGSGPWTIEVQHANTLAGSSMTITYGDTNGGLRATAPASPEKSEFTTAVQSVSGTGTLTPIATSPTVNVSLSDDGSGTMSVTPSSVNINSTGQTLTFVYTPPSGLGLAQGEIDVAVPTGWSAPSTTSTEQGYFTASAGTASVSGRTIQVKNLDLSPGQTFTVVYGDQSGGGPGATVSNTPGDNEFTTKQRAATGGTLTALAVQPKVNVVTGTMTVTPTSVTTSATTSLTFTYTPAVGAPLINGIVTVTVPAGWSAPQTTDSTQPGYTSQPVGAGSLTRSGNVITVSVASLVNPQTFAFTYGDVSSDAGGAAVASSSAGTSTFTTVEKVDAAALSHNLATSPTVTVTAPPPPGGGGGGGGGGGSFGHPDLTRVSGADRIATSVAASQAAFPKASSARVAVLARSDSFADALAGTPLAAKDNGPLLLTMTAALPTMTATELNRVLPLGSTVYLLGGTSAVSPNVQDALTVMGYSVTRLAGADRYATAVAVADAQGDPTTVFEADGTNFPDALSAGSAAAREGAAVLLTAHATQSAATAAYLAAHPSVRYAVGGPAAKADPGATPLVGADRYATSVAVATMFFNAPLSVGLASGMNFPDALSGGAVAANHGGPILLVPKDGTVSAATTSYLTQTAALSASSAWLFGGTASVSDGVFSQAAAALKATAP